MREINSEGFHLLKTFEGCKLAAYRDIGGVLTIGYGHTGPDVKEGDQISQQQADDLLKKDLERFYQLDHYVSEQVNDNQYSAMICLAYNIGLGALKTSGIIREVNDGNSPDSIWLQYNHVKGVVITGLTRRRKAELELYHKLEAV